MLDRRSELEETLDRIDLKFGKSYRKGSYVFKQGEWGDKMFIIKEGKLKVVQEINGIEIDSFIVDKGEIVGELSIIDPQKRYASGIALEESFILILAKNDFIEVVSKNPVFSLIIMQTLAKIIRRADEELNIFRTGNFHLIVVNKINEILNMKSIELNRENNITYSTNRLIQRVTQGTKATGSAVRMILEQLTMKNILGWDENEVKIKDINRLKNYKESLKKKEGLT